MAAAQYIAQPGGDKVLISLSPCCRGHKNAQITSVKDGGRKGKNPRTARYRFYIEQPLIRENKMPQTRENSLPHFRNKKCPFFGKSTCRLQRNLQSHNIPPIDAHMTTKALRCIPTAKGFHNMDRSSRKPSRMTSLHQNLLIRRIKGDHATVIKLLSKEPL